MAYFWEQDEFMWLKKFKITVGEDSNKNVLPII